METKNLLYTTKELLLNQSVAFQNRIKFRLQLITPEVKFKYSVFVI